MSTLLKKRIGIMGGTFDPPHYGHLAAAQAALEAFDLEKVLFVPSGMPPHKSAAEMSAADHRLNMTRLATAGQPRFAIDSVEMNRPGPHYTVDTVRILQEQHPDASLYLIVGADMAVDFPHWREPAALLASCQLVAATRPGYDLDELKAKWRLSGIAASRQHILPTAGVAVSSTDIRQRLQQGKSCRYLAPDAVLQYAEAHRLYNEQSPFTPSTLLSPAEAADWVKRRISQRRYAHTLRVMDEAVRLAAIHGVDEYAAQLAACLHDCARDLPPAAQLKLAEASGIVMTGAFPQAGELLHAYAGATLVRQELGISDSRVLAAIRSHTTGRAGMSPLEQVVFLADMVEPGRDFPGVADLRAVAEVDLNQATLKALDHTILYVIGKGAYLHVASIEARNDLLDLCAHKEGTGNGRSANKKV